MNRVTAMRALASGTRSVAAGAAHAELLGVVIEVLGAEVVHVEQGHGVAEIGVSADGEVHRPVERVVTLAVKVTVECGNWCGRTTA